MGLVMKALHFFEFWQLCALTSRGRGRRFALAQAQSWSRESSRESAKAAPAGVPPPTGT
jgi:hypothetical protein